MNTKRQSKKVKRKTKTYKKRNIRKYGGGESHYLYSDMNHGLTKRPVYKFNVVNKMGSGGFGSAYLGKIHCEPNSWFNKRQCIKEYSDDYPIGDNEIIPMFSVTLQNMKKKGNAKGIQNESFPFSKQYILRIYGESDKKYTNKREFIGTKIHKILSAQCSNYVCTLFDYGTILKKKSKEYMEIAARDNNGEKSSIFLDKHFYNCDENDCLYALLEKGKMSMFDYVYREVIRAKKKMDKYTYFISFMKQLYIIAMKMIRNIYCLHSKDIMHYDIKLENCVFFPIDSNVNVDDKNIENICNLEKEFINDVKLIDFGLSSQLTQENYMHSRENEGTKEFKYMDYQNDEYFPMGRSGFPDIYAILKHIDNFYQYIRTHKRVNFSINSEIFGKFGDKEWKGYKGIQSNLPEFLNTQREILQNMSRYKFNPLPYQNILTKLKDEYDVLIRPR